MSPRQSPLVSALALGALALMVASWFAPIWWVSLTAPNYPAERFPDGIRIHFDFHGVKNGCTSAAKTSRVAKETQQEDLGWRSEGGQTPKASDGPTPDDGATLDCVREMNTINHYVGMRPIGVGAPVEIMLARYILGMLAVMMLGFAVGAQKLRTAVLASGFAAVSLWMLVEQHGLGQLAAYVAAYKTEAGTYFRETERIDGWGVTLTRVTTGIEVLLIALMALATVATWKWKKFQLLLALMPALLPVFFVMAYAAWLGFFGHNMHPWGAFTLKPFMPTVFGEGKVAQFSTHSYPHWGFGLLAGMFLLLTLAAARRRFELLEEAPAEPAPAAPTTTEPKAG